MRIEGARVFVTGGAGFIGSHIVHDLVKSGAAVSVYDNLSSGLAENLTGVRPDVRLVAGDIQDVEHLTREMRGADVVSHHAAQLEITKCVADPVADLQTNAIGTLNVLNAAVANGIGRVINASSACVYGQATYVPEDEGHPTNPNWAYGVSKLAAEKYGQVYEELYGMKVTSLRYAIVYGEREWYGRVLTIFLKRALRGEPPVVFGDGSQERDLTYVGDAVRLHRACLEMDGTGVFNVSTGVATRVRELAEMVREIAGLQAETVYEQVPVGGRSGIVEDNRQRLPSELAAMVLSPQKALQELNWQPLVSVREGLQREYEWLEANVGRWSKLSY